MTSNKSQKPTVSRVTPFAEGKARATLRQLSFTVRRKGELNEPSNEN